MRAVAGMEWELVDVALVTGFCMLFAGLWVIVGLGGALAIAGAVLMVAAVWLSYASVRAETKTKTSAAPRRTGG